VGLALSVDGIRAESFFMRAPHENAAEVYRMLLARNARARRCYFAVDGLGDIYLIGFCAAGDAAGDELDRLLGELLTVADQMFNACVGRGFATYLAKDMAWRAKQPRA
ncbi:MAG: YbjN domain-containing protein, partial [bacterium]